MENASLWSPDHPNLYNLTLEIGEQKSHCLHDRWSHYVGIRSIEIDGPRLLVNGEPFIIQGVNRYENYPDTGMTPNDSGLHRDVDLIKRMGGNAVRCHYPNSPGTYDLYDRMGLFSVCEVPLYQWGRPGHSTKNLDAAKVQLEEMIRTLRNHPSVLMWSVSNETRTRPREEGEEHRLLSEMVVKGNLELAENGARTRSHAARHRTQQPLAGRSGFQGAGRPVTQRLPGRQNSAYRLAARHDGEHA